MTEKSNIISLYAIKGDCINVETLRGFARISDIAKISNADVYDSINNKKGTQRDLKPKHAKDAYNYCIQEMNSKKMWPEVVLNIRDERKVKIRRLSKTRGGDLVKIQIDLNSINISEDNPTISRVDGNHRLYYANGDPKGKDKKFKSLEIVVPFAITIGVSREDEVSIFRDINEHQEGINTSHLKTMEYRLSSEDEIDRFGKSPGLWIAMQLSDRNNSPFLGKIYKGGKKGDVEYLANLGSFVNNMKILYDQSDILQQYYNKKKNIELIYDIIKRFWISVEKVFYEEWINKKTFIMIGSVGLKGLSQFGGYFIDYLADRFNNITEDQMIEVLMELKTEFSWKKADWEGVGGTKGAKYIFEKLKGNLPEKQVLEEITV